MEISTASSLSPRGAGHPVPTQDRYFPATVSSAQAVAPVSAAEPALQGEWLGREIPRAVPRDELSHSSVYHMAYARRYGQTYPGVELNRLAINAYLGHTREGMRDASGRGRSVDYFV